MTHFKHLRLVAAALALTLALPVPALAQAPDLGPDWELVGSRKVKTWVPHPSKPGDGKWEMVDFNTYRLFQENLSNPAPDMPAPASPEIQLGPIKQGKAYDEKREIERVRKGLLIHKYQTIVNVTPQTRTETTIQKGWTLSAFTQEETRSRALRTKYGLYNISFQVPVKNYRWDLVEVGRSQRELTLAPIEVARVVELLPPERTSDVGSLATANASRPGVFRGDAGSGGKATLQASRLRQQMGANQVKASQVTLTPEEIEEARKQADEEAAKQFEAEQQAKAKAEEERKKAPGQLSQVAREKEPVPEKEQGFSIAGALGEWISTGGKSVIAISRNGNSNTMRIQADLVLGNDKISKSFPSVAFGKSWQGDLGKDKLGAKYYLKATFNDKLDRMEVKIWRDGLINSTVAEGDFVKRK